MVREIIAACAGTLYVVSISFLFISKSELFQYKIFKFSYYSHILDMNLKYTTSSKNGEIAKISVRCKIFEKVRIDHTNFLSALESARNALQVSLKA